MFPSRIWCARCVTSAASRSRRSRIIAVRFVRFSPGRPRALALGPRPRSMRSVCAGRGEKSSAGLRDQAP